VTRKTVNDFPPEVLKLFDGYVHGRVTRREFLDRAAKFAVGGVTAAALLESLQPNFALAQQVPEEDPRVRTDTVQYPSPRGSGTMKGYLAQSMTPQPRRACVVVIHENRGLSPYIKDVARRLAVEGYTAFAPDALSVVGGYPGDEDKARELFSKLDPAKRNEDLFAAVDYLKARGDCNGRIGAIGFCFGGGIVNQIAVRYPDLSAGAPFYGSQPKSEDAAKIKAPLMLHYAENDDGINKGIPAFEEALKAAGVKVQVYKYPGTYHGFHNDTTPRYDEGAAKLAWSRTLAFFQEHLKA
jgi:carboxymethylenebutenolidase